MAHIKFDYSKVSNYVGENELAQLQTQITAVDKQMMSSCSQYCTYPLFGI